MKKTTSLLLFLGTTLSLQAYPDQDSFSADTDHLFRYHFSAVVSGLVMIVLSGLFSSVSLRRVARIAAVAATALFGFVLT